MKTELEIITEYKQLEEQANKLLQEHQSFKVYNNIRLKMDKLEEIMDYLNIEY